MAEPATKRRKTDADSHRTAAPQITDPRFTQLQSDPRYRLPSKRNKQQVKLDQRFAKVLHDDDFVQKSKVDRYGRPLENDAERNRLKRRYEVEGDDGGPDDDLENESVDDDDKVQEELQRVAKIRDPLREGRVSGDMSSSDDESSSSSEDEEDMQVLETELPGNSDNDVPTGEVTSRIAVVNLDWDNVGAADLMAVFSSFLPASGRLLKVAIYPSEFGKERMEREQMEGPPKEIFAAVINDAGSDELEDDEILKANLLTAQASGETTDFNSTALRNYQLSRLRYFYAILTFSDPNTAKAVYDDCDGAEYLSSANFFDLRFVPDDTDFSSDQPREECESVPPGYKPNEFVTEALQHSKVKLTWDAEEEGKRREVAARAFRSGKEWKKEIDESDLKAYLGSDTSDDQEEDENMQTHLLPIASAAVHPLTEVHATATSKKEQERQRVRALLGLAPEPAPKSSRPDDRPVGDLQITFSAGLSTKDTNEKQSVFENEASALIEETTAEKYVRKERERKAKRRDKMKSARSRVEDNAEQITQVDKEQVEAQPSAKETDLGFDDPFFAEPDAQQSRKEEHKIRKDERRRKREEREHEEEVQLKEREQLALLLDDGDGAEAGKGTRTRHFDMTTIERAEKKARKDAKRKQKHNGLPGRAAEADDFALDNSDPRFAQLYGDHDFAIDPTNPRFRDTKAMRGLLEETRQRRRERDSGREPEVDDKGKSQDKGETKKRSSGKRVDADENESVKALVNNVRERS